MITPAYSVTATERVLPRMALDFTTGALDPRVTVTRADNTATCFNASGFIETVNANLPRFDYNSLTLQCKGILIEEARTNLFLYSNQFDQFPWTVGDATISVNTTISPLGVQNADTLVEAANNSVHFLFAISALQPAGTYTYSIYVKPNGRTKFRLQQNDTTAFAVLFDLTAQTVTPIAGGATGAIEPVKNGWFRCSMTYTTAVPITLTNVVYLADSSGSISYLGDGVSGLHLSAAQLEAGAFATSYIPTTTTSLTRNADAVSMTGTNFSDWYSPTQGTLTVTADSGNVPDADVVVRMAAVISDTVGFTNAVRLERVSGQYRAVTTVAGAAELVVGTWNANTTGTLVSAYGSNAAAAFNGAATQPFAQTAPVSPLFLGIGSNSASANFFCGHIKAVRYFPQRLTNAEVQAFSK